METANFKYKAVVTFVFLHILSGTINLQGQNNADYIEQIQLITDRSVYATSEKVSFKAFYSIKEEKSGNEINVTDDEWSTVLYLELIAPDGATFFQAKYPLSADGASGAFILPENVLTGNYYLRAYTRWMRNFSPYQYAYKLLKIINPNSKELLQPKSQQNQDSIINDSNKKKILTEIVGLDSSYNKRSPVNFTIKNPFKDKNQQIVLSVIKLGAGNYFNVDFFNKTETYNFEYIPETQGVSLSGKIVDKENNQPLPYHRVNLTVFDKISKNLGVISDNAGKFYFMLPGLNGEVEVFLTVNKKKENEQPIILVDNDFCAKPVELPFFAFEYTPDDMKLFNEISVNNQLASIYMPQYYKNKELMTDDSLFYGKPQTILYLKNYIELPTIEDYVIELMPMVNIRKKKKEYQLKILGDFPEMNIYDPLILVDLVTIPDIENLLKVSPRKIQRIDVIDKPYIKGGIIYGGIINFISKKSDFAGIDLPESGKFFTYKMFQPLLKEKKNTLSNKRLPQVENTLYWNSNVNLEPGQTKDITFYTGDTKGKYILLFTLKDGEENPETNFISFTVN